MKVLKIIMIVLTVVIYFVGMFIDSLYIFCFCMGLMFGVYHSEWWKGGLWDE